MKKIMGSLTSLSLPKNPGSYFESSQENTTQYRGICHRRGYIKTNTVSELFCPATNVKGTYAQ